MTTRRTRDPEREPMHPGALLREDVLPAQRISVADAAGKLGIRRQTLHAILAERTSVTPEMAVRPGKFCGNGPDLRIKLQTTRDLCFARRKLPDTVDRIPTMRAA